MKRFSRPFLILIPLALASCGPPLGLRFDPVSMGLEADKVEWSGGKLQTYKTATDGAMTTVIFVHGSPGGASGWSRYLEDPELKRRFRLVAYDRPGYGESGLPWRTLGAQVEALNALVDEQGGNVILVGHSLGGAVVLGASTDRRIVRTIVLAGSVDPGLGPTRPLNAFLKFTGLEYALPTPLRISNKEVYALRPALKELGGRLGEIGSPVTIVQGERDLLVPAANVEYLREKLPSEPRVILLKREGHFLPWKQFDLAKALLLSGQ